LPLASTNFLGEELANRENKVSITIIYGAKKDNPNELPPPQKDQNEDDDQSRRNLENEKK